MERAIHSLTHEQRWKEGPGGWEAQHAVGPLCAPPNFPSPLLSAAPFSYLTGEESRQMIFFLLLRWVQEKEESHSLSSACCLCWSSLSPLPASFMQSELV